MNNFKFVLAGVHDLCRTVKNRNTIFGQLGAPLVIKPLAPTDAVRLLSLPLSYFGFGLEVKAIQKILLNTLYYPGIIHSFGAEILKKLSNNYNLYFNDINNPPYQLNESQLNRLITDIDLNQKINEKIKMTLRVDAYNYLVLAYAIGILYFDFKNQGLVVGQGFTAFKILSTIKEYMDKNFEHLMHWEGITTDETQSFLDEMEEMGIITSSQYATNSPKLYRFRRRRFLDALGTSFDDLFYKITEGFK
jgi:hypothetical protein